MTNLRTHETLQLVLSISSEDIYCDLPAIACVLLQQARAGMVPRIAQQISYIPVNERGAPRTLLADGGQQLLDAQPLASSYALTTAAGGSWWVSNGQSGGDAPARPQSATAVSAGPPHGALLSLSECLVALESVGRDQTGPSECAETCPPPCALVERQDFAAGREFPQKHMLMLRTQSSRWQFLAIDTLHMLAVVTGFGGSGSPSCVSQRGPCVSGRGLDVAQLWSG